MAKTFESSNCRVFGMYRDEMGRVFVHTEDAAPTCMVNGWFNSLQGYKQCNKFGGSIVPFLASIDTFILLVLSVPMWAGDPQGLP